MLFRLPVLAAISLNFGGPTLSQKAGDPLANGIKALFQAPQGQTLNYPPAGVKGPKPRDVWVKAYEKAKSAGLIPSIPSSTLQNFRPVYPSSFTGKTCNPGLQNPCYDSLDIRNAPAGVAGISFDDGPEPASLELISYLKTQSQKATHFLIGSQVLKNPDIFKALDQSGGELAVHTWSHPYLTSLSDLEVLGELGWTMQIIHDKSQGRVVSNLLRPSFGDTDLRVQAIAKHVFGLKSVFWRFDSQDYCLSDSKPDGSDCAPGSGPQNLGDLKNSLDKFITSDKKDGLIILEHEKNKRAVEGFKYIFPRMKQSGWTPKSIADMSGSSPYQ